MGNGPPGNRATRLTRTSGTIALPRTSPLAGGSVPIRLPNTFPQVFREIMYAEAEVSFGRIVMVVADLPADVFLEYTGGGGAGQRALLTLTQSARVGIDARTIRIWAFNRADADNRLNVSLGDGDQSTHNSWIAEFNVNSPPTGGLIAVPPMAEGLRAVSNLGTASVAQLAYVNAQGTTVGLTPVVVAAVRPAVIAGATSITIIGGVAGEIITCSFDLGL